MEGDKPAQADETPQNWNKCPNHVWCMCMCKNKTFKGTALSPLMVICPTCGSNEYIPYPIKCELHSGDRIKEPTCMAMCLNQLKDSDKSVRCPPFCVISNGFTREGVNKFYEDALKRAAVQLLPKVTLAIEDYKAKITECKKILTQYADIVSAKTHADIVIPEAVLFGDDAMREGDSTGKKRYNLSVFELYAFASKLENLRLSNFQLYTFENMLDVFPTPITRVSDKPLHSNE